RASDEIGAIRRFQLASGEWLSEQLLRLSDRAHAFSYAIVDSDVPLFDYVAHVELKPVTDSGRTFWRWWSQFRAPDGRESEMATLVAEGVYDAGFDGLRRSLDTRPRTVVGAGDLAGQSVIADRHGGPDVLRYAPCVAPAPGQGEVRLKQSAIGVNFIDVYTRTGYFGLIEPPAVLGMEAAGTVVDTGPGVNHLKPGDRVGYACAPPGAYASIRTMPADLVVKLPDEIDDQTAAALLKGVTAWFLLHKVHRLEPGQTALVFAPAGGVGHLLVQWAARLGARVIAATTTDQKANAALASGASDVVRPGMTSLEDQVKALTAGRGVDVVFDAVGRDSFQHSLAALATCGHLVSFGQASGDIGAREIGPLAAKSITLSRPNYGHYTDTPQRMNEACSALFSALKRGDLRVDIGQRFALSEAATAHAALESRQTIGTTIMIPEDEE
ncbi:MAG: zinc-binding dehydrogenase, partial [Pseudomonadota bacterium]